MNLFQLKTMCGAILDKNDPASLTIGGVDMFLAAANAVRREAELSHDFEYSRITAAISINGLNGGSLAGLTLAGDATAGVAKVTNVTNGFGRPIDFLGLSEALVRQENIENTGDLCVEMRYPSDWLYVSRGTSSAAVIQRGQKLYVYPFFLFDGTGDSAETVTLNLEGYGLLPEYTDSMLMESQREVAPQDFILANGGRFLQWAIVVELNYIFQKFVPRTEGALSPPEAARDKAWAALVEWDNHLVL